MQTLQIIWFPILFVIAAFVWMALALRRLFYRNRPRATVIERGEGEAPLVVVEPDDLTH